jgi:hypothetical protein
MVKNQAEQVNQLATPELATAQELQNREQVTARKRTQRAREKQAKELHEASQDRQQFWADNLAKLKTAELEALEAQQQDFLVVAWMVQNVTENLMKPGVLIGGPDGICYPDAVFQEATAWENATNPDHRIIWHANPEEFAEIHRPENSGLQKMFSSSDPEWWSFGIYSRFQVGVLDEFVKVVAAFIEANPDHEAFDPDISKKILEERAKRLPRKTAQVVRNIPEGGRTPDGSEESWVERENDRERLRSLRDLAKLPVRDF